MAKDLSNLSDDELEKIAASGVSQVDLSKISDDELEKIASQKNAPSLGEDVGVKLTEGLLFGARPFVAGVGGGLGAAMAKSGDPNLGLMERIKSLPQSFQSGFSEARQGALAEEAGVSQRRPGMSTAVGIGTALATAPLLAAKGLQAVKAGGILSGAGSAARVGAGLGATHALGHAESSGEAIESIGTGAAAGMGTQIGANIIAKAAPAIGRAIGRGAKKTASALTGVSEKEISTYASRADEVKALMKKSGGDISEAADQVRQGVMKEIQVTRQKLNNQIGDALKSDLYYGRAVDGTPVIKSLEDTLAKVSKTSAEFRPGEINELKNVIDTTRKFIGQDGTITVQQLQGVKEELQKIAKSSYMNGAVIFPKGEMAANGAKAAAAEAKRLMDVAVPEVAKANQQLSRLHAIENVMNKNLIKAGKPESALLAAGSGGNPRSAKLLRAIDSVTGGSAARGAENLAAARTFGSAPLMPVDFTGKSLARMAAGFGAGTVAGGPLGGVVGTALASPASLKLVLDTQRLIKAVGGSAAKSIGGAISGPAARAALISGESQNAIEKSSINGAMNRRMQRLRGNKGKPAINE